jgi:hypothetical protein
MTLQMYTSKAEAEDVARRYSKKEGHPLIVKTKTVYVVVQDRKKSKSRK